MKPYRTEVLRQELKGVHALDLIQRQHAAPMLAVLAYDHMIIVTDLREPKLVAIGRLAYGVREAVHQFNRACDFAQRHGLRAG